MRVNKRKIVTKNVNDSNKHVLLNLMQNYEAEFSPITKKHPDQNGIYKLDTKLDRFHNGFLFYYERNPIGFAITGKHSGNYDIAEFYIIPLYRGNGVGKFCAIKIFKKFQGNWQVRQIAGADGAINFWRSVIGEFTANNYSEDKMTAKFWGKVTRQKFKTHK